MRRRISLLILAVLIVSMFAGCNYNKTPATTLTPSPVVTNTPATTHTPSPVVTNTPDIVPDVTDGIVDGDDGIITDNDGVTQRPAVTDVPVTEKVVNP